uniref:Uncharacterized protein n=1 Tax=Haemonchus contortus TaxID=6289 RepID=A0A7I4XTZ1_HAECO
MENLPSTSETQSTSTSETQSTSKKRLSHSKIRQLIDTREKIIHQLEKLGQREVSLNPEDEAKEQFYFNKERDLKKFLISIEKKLHDNGVLEDVDEDLEAFYSDKSSYQVAVAETGNELLNHKLTRLFNEKLKKNGPTTTLSFEELNEVMKEVRAEQGDSSDIPDPERESGAFLDLLEHVALVVARAHQNFVSSQFLDRLDLFVPKPERSSCFAPPELDAEMRKLLSDNASRRGVPDEIFHMEMQAAGRWEREHPEQNATGDEIDIANENDDDEDEGEDLEDDVEEEECQKVPSSSSTPLSYSPVNFQADAESVSMGEGKVQDASISQYEADKEADASELSTEAAQCLNVDEMAGSAIDGLLNNEEKGVDDCMATNKHNSTTHSPSSVSQDQTVPSKRRRMEAEDAFAGVTDSKTVEIICLDD